jgi:diguanylate cyclase (GGDEF)-like protein
MRPFSSGVPASVAWRYRTRVCPGNIVGFGERDRYWIEDLGSTNRTYLNGKPIRRAELRDGDQIGVGTNAIKFFIGASLEARYHDELIDLALYDSLTGFYNRRHFQALLAEELEKTRNAPLSLLLIDLDHFKSINDRFGHLIGDQVLSGVAQVPTEAPIGRLGGEEFAVLWRGDAASAATLAERLRAAVAARPIETREHTLAVTMSIGIAQTGARTETGTDLLRRADEELYRAKRGGRNRVCMAD